MLTLQKEKAMNFELIVASIVALMLLGSAWVYLARRSHRKNRIAREKSILQWIEEVETSTTDHELYHGPIRRWVQDFEYKRLYSFSEERLVAAKTKFAELSVQRQKTLMGEYLAIEDFDERRSNLRRLIGYNCVLSDEDVTSIVEFMSSDMVAHTAELLEEAQDDDDRSSFLRLQGLVAPASMNRYERIPYQEDTGEFYPYPSDWNILVAKFNEFPGLSLFTPERRDLSPQQVGDLAVEALKGHSLLLTKLVLAHCKERSECLEWVPDSLRADLLRLQNTLHASKGYVYQ